MDEEPKVETPRTQIPRTAKDGEMSDFLSFKEVLSELGLGEDELNEVVSNGGLRGFREGDEVKFKREDITNLKKSRETEPTIVLSDTQADRVSGGEDEEIIDLDSLSTDETVLNIEGLLEDETEGTTPIPGAGILESDDEIQIGAVGEETVLDTDDLDLGDDFELTDDDTILADESATLVAGGGRANGPDGQEGVSRVPDRPAKSSRPPPGRKPTLQRGYSPIRTQETPARAKPDRG